MLRRRPLLGLDMVAVGQRRDAAGDVGRRRGGGRAVARQLQRPQRARE